MAPITNASESLPRGCSSAENKICLFVSMASLQAHLLINYFLRGSHPPTGTRDPAPSPASHGVAWGSHQSHHGTRAAELLCKRSSGDALRNPGASVTPLASLGSSMRRA